MRHKALRDQVVVVTGASSGIGLATARMIPGARFERLPGVGHMLHHVRADAVVEAARAVRQRS